MDFSMVNLDEYQKEPETLAQMILNHTDLFLEMLTLRRFDIALLDELDFLYKRVQRIAIRKKNPNKWRVQYKIDENSGFISTFSIITEEEASELWTNTVKEKRNLDLFFPMIDRGDVKISKCESLRLNIIKYLFSGSDSQVLGAKDSSQFFATDANFQKQKTKTEKRIKDKNRT